MMTAAVRLSALCLALVLLAGLLTPPSAQGQVLISLLLGDKVSSEKFHLGLNVGLNISDVSGIDGTKARTGFTLGILGEWRFARSWYLQPELGVFYNAGAKNLPLGTFPIPPEVEDIVVADEVLWLLKYFTIPLLIKYGVAENRLHLGVGPQIGFLTSSAFTFKGTSSIGNKVTVEQDVKDGTTSTDAGVLFNVE
jgi:hypothetical protein